MSYLIDSGIIAELRKAQRCNRNVAMWYAGLREDELHLSVLAIAGVTRTMHLVWEHDNAAGASIADWITATLHAFKGRILPVDAAVAREWGRLQVMRPIAVTDGLVAATASVHGLTLATRNTAYLAGCGVDLVNPFLPGSGNHL